MHKDALTLPTRPPYKVELGALAHGLILQDLGKDVPVHGGCVKIHEEQVIDAAAVAVAHVAEGEGGVELLVPLLPLLAEEGEEVGDGRER